MSLEPSFDVMAALMNSVRNPYLTMIMQFLGMAPQQRLPIGLLDFVSKRIFLSYRRFRIMLPSLVVLGLGIWILVYLGCITLAEMPTTKYLSWSWVTLATICTAGFPVIYYGWFLPHYISAEKGKWLRYERAIRHMIQYSAYIRNLRHMPELTVSIFPQSGRNARKFADEHLLEFARAIVDSRTKPNTPNPLRDSMRTLLKAWRTLNMVDEADSGPKNAGIKPYFDRISENEPVKVSAKALKD